jgi:hypothetical protein
VPSTLTPIAFCLLKTNTSIGQLQTHLEQLVHNSSIIFIDASFSSIASSGQIPTQHPQKSHLSGFISINSNKPALSDDKSFNFPLKVKKKNSER